MKHVLKLLTLLITTTLLNSCAFNSGGTTTGNGIVAINFGTYSLASLSNVQTMAVTDLKMCFKRLRFKTDTTDSSDPATDEDNIDFEIGEVNIDQAGTFLGEVEVPRGVYSRVEFDLEKDCVDTSTPNSVTFTNGSTYTTQDRVTIKFEGTFTLFSESQELTLDIGALITALENNVTDGSEIKEALETAIGGF